MNDEQARRKVRVDLEELRFAIEDASYEHRYFLDIETGEVILKRISQYDADLPPTGKVAIHAKLAYVENSGKAGQELGA